MNALKSSIQRQLFAIDDERLAAIVNVTKQDGKKKKRPTYLCIAITAHHPISVRIYTVKSEREESYRKKDTWQLRDIRMIDGINPRKRFIDENTLFQPLEMLMRPSADFFIQHNEKLFKMTASTVEEKESFIQQLQKLCSKYTPIQMPEFINVPLLVEDAAYISEAVEDIPDVVHETLTDYQPISAKEEADFRRLLSNSELTINEADKFAQVLSEQLQSLDGANIQSMMGSEQAVEQLLHLIDQSLDKVSHLEKELDKCDHILAHVRDSVELMEEKDTLCVVERKNKERLQKELQEFVTALDTVTERHLKVLEEANISDPASIARCSEAARAFNAFHRGRIAKPMENMRAWQEKSNVRDTVNLFVDRFMSHLNALFHNLNELTESQDWNSLIIPKQSQRFHALSPLSELISWLKSFTPHVYQTAIDRYVMSTRGLYKKLFDRFFDNIILELKKMSAEKRANASMSSKHSSSTMSSLDFSDHGHLVQLIETVLGELSPIVEMEQKFVVRFFHINADLLAAAENVSQNSGDSGSLGGKSLERQMNDQVRQVMAPLFDSLVPQLDRFCEAVCKQNPSNILVLFVIISKKVLAPADASSYFAVTFGSLTVLIKRQFDTYMESEAQALSDVRISKRSRLGILPNIYRFGEFVRFAERVFEGAERRTDLEKWYLQLHRAVCDGITRASLSSYSKSPPSVVRFENYHQLYMTLSELKVSCLDQQRKQAKTEKEDNIDIYVKEYMGRPLEKIHIFFENVQNAIDRGLKVDEVSYQQQFSRMELKRVISMYSGKEVKKGLDQLYKKVEKHLIDGSSLLQVVWRNMQDQFIKQLQSYQALMTQCYASSRPELEVSIQDVLQYFSEIAQQH